MVKTMMNNEQLEKKIQELLNITNYLDFVEQVCNFNKEYKKSEFYVHTKMPLMDLVKNARLFYNLNFKTILDTAQKFLDNLDLEHLMGLVEQVGTVFTNENTEIQEMLKTAQDIFTSEEIKNN